MNYGTVCFHGLTSFVENVKGFTETLKWKMLYKFKWFETLNWIETIVFLVRLIAFASIAPGLKEIILCSLDIRGTQ